MAVLLTSLRYLGYFPATLHEVPSSVKTFIAHQLHLLWDPGGQYPADERTQRYHLALMRQHTGWRAPTADDKARLEQWLCVEGTRDATTAEELLEQAYGRLRQLQIELPAEQELHRLVHAALHAFFQAVYQRVTSRLSPAVCATLDALVVVGPDETHSRFDRLKAEPAAPGVKNLQQEITKLDTLRTIGVPAEACADVPFKVLQTLKRRAHNEDASKMRAHPAPIRYALLACFISVRTMEVIDDAVRMTLEVIRRMDTQTEKHLEKTLLQDIKRVTGKVQLLYRIAEAVVDAPDGTIRNVLFPCIKEETFHDLVLEAKASHPQYRIWYQSVMRRKFMRHYRRMLPLVLEHLTFRSENRFQPVIEALAVIKQYLPHEIPVFS